MLELTSARWRDLDDAYGSAQEIPGLLAQLRRHPPCDDDRSEPYFSLWSALCHQGDVYSASYAAVPHIIQFAAEAPARAHWSLLYLPTRIEISRVKGDGPVVPPDLMEDYRAAYARLPGIIAEMQENQSSDDFALASAAAIAIACGHATLAEAILELTASVIPDFLAWLANR